MLSPQTRAVNAEELSDGAILIRTVVHFFEALVLPLPGLPSAVLIQGDTESRK